MSDRRARRKERVRRDLLDAAVALFSERGIYATRIEDITERADLGKGAFYNYFDSKDALVAALVTEGVEILDERYLKPLDRGVSAEVQLAEIVRRHAEFFDDHPEYVVLFHQARGLMKFDGSAPPLRDVFTDYLARVGRSLPAPVPPAVWTDEARSDMAAALVGALAGYRSFRLASGQAPQKGTIVRALSAGLPSMIPGVAEK